MGGQTFITSEPKSDQLKDFNLLDSSVELMEHPVSIFKEQSVISKLPLLLGLTQGLGMTSTRYVRIPKLDDL